MNRLDEACIEPPQNVSPALTRHALKRPRLEEGGRAVRASISRPARSDIVSADAQRSARIKSTDGESCHRAGPYRESRRFTVWLVHKKRALSPVETAPAIAISWERIRHAASSPQAAPPILAELSSAEALGAISAAAWYRTGEPPMTLRPANPGVCSSYRQLRCALDLLHRKGRTDVVDGGAFDQ